MGKTLENFLWGSLGLGTLLGAPLFAQAREQGYLDKAERYEKSVASTGSQKDPATGVNYAIVVREETAGREGWKEVVLDLQQKYPHSSVHTFTSDILETRESLASQSPTHVAYVATPQELAIPSIGNNPIEWASNLEGSAQGAFSLLLRNLEPEGTAQNPYFEAVGGIITGRTAEDARSLANADPLQIKRGLFKTLGERIEYFPEGISFSDGAHSEGVLRLESTEEGLSQSYVSEAGPEFFDFLNNNSPQLVFVNGHANHDRWQAGFDYTDDLYVVNPKSGKIEVFKQFDGNTPLFALEKRTDEEGKPFSIDSPFAFLTWGSCQPSRIISPENSFALAMIHEGAVFYAGHTSNSWYSEGTVGIDTPLFWSNVTPSLPVARHQALQLTAYNMAQADSLKEKEGLTGLFAPGFGDAHDMLSYVAYGDPALEVTIAKREEVKPPFTFEVTTTPEAYSAILRINEDVSIRGTQPSLFLPQEFHDSRIVLDSEGVGYVAHDILIFDIGRDTVKKGDALAFTRIPLKEGEEYTVVLEK